MKRTTKCQQHTAFLIFVAATCLMFGGCGSEPYRPAGTVEVKGTLTREGQPLEVEGRDIGLGQVTIGFWELPENAYRDEIIETAVTTVDETGQFELIDGLPPGKYLVTVRQWDPYPNIDRLKERFDQKNSPIEIEVTDDQELKIELNDYAK